MYTIPVSIELNNVTFPIRNKGDYRMVLDCFSALEDIELAPLERIYAALIIFYADINSMDDLNKLPDIREATQKMFDFFNCNRANGVGKQTNYKLIDWQQDEQLVCAAINKVANTEIRLESYIHWWTFMGYYAAIGECPLSTILSIRHKLVTGRPLEKHEQRFKRENPEYFVWNSLSSTDTEADKLIREMWDNGV